LDEVDIKWDNIFSAKISKYIDVNLNVKLFYDKDISEDRQLKQSLALGLTYTFL
jgi:cytochrome c oxidase assembly protein Cox11